MELALSTFLAEDIQAKCGDRIPVVKFRITMECEALKEL